MKNVHHVEDIDHVTEEEYKLVAAVFQLIVVHQIYSASHKVLTTGYGALVCNVVALTIRKSTIPVYHVMSEM